MTPFRVHKTGLKFPFKIEDHVAVTWKNTTIVWGGYNENTSTSLSEVNCHQSGEWIKGPSTYDNRKNFGYPPPYFTASSPSHSSVFYIQGEPSGSSKPIVDIDLKVAF